MRWFWNTFIISLLEALKPDVVVEIGAEHGDVTIPLLHWADAHRAVVHVIDPAPLFDVTALKRAHRHSFHFHGTRSLRVLPRIASVDLVLIDGDHNWHTVINELRQIERRARRDARLPPVVLLHDVEWPYGRRDLYYEPDAIPARRRHPYAKAGLLPGITGLREEGLNSSLNNALSSGGAANGVLTAVEDFLAESRRSWSLTVIPGLYGLGILVPMRLLNRRPRVRAAIEATNSADFLTAHCRAIEAARIAAVIRASSRTNTGSTAHREPGDREELPRPGS